MALQVPATIVLDHRTLKRMLRRQLENQARLRGIPHILPGMNKPQLLAALLAYDAAHAPEQTPAGTAPALPVEQPVEQAPASGKPASGRVYLVNRYGYTITFEWHDDVVAISRRYRGAEMGTDTLTRTAARHYYATQVRNGFRRTDKAEGF